MIARESLDGLAAFARIASLRSFTRAAAELNTSTSNLSHIVRKLEGRLGARLLQRTSRSVSPTEAGEALLASLDPALATIRDAIDALQAGGGEVVGTLRLTVTRQAYDAVVAPMLAAFLAAHPRATVETMIGFGFRDVVADRFDAGIRLGEKIAGDMVATRVGPDLRMAVVASPDYLDRHGAPRHPRDLTGHRCANYRLETAGTLYAWEFERDGEGFDVRVDGPVTFNDPAPMLQCALQGLCVAYVLEHEAMPHIRAGEVVRLLEDWTPPFPGFFLYHPSRRQPRPVLTAFVAALKSASRRSTTMAGRGSGSGPA